jgi:hypothetical protein
LIVDRVTDSTTAQEAIPMSTPNTYPLARDLSDWWASPPRRGLQRLINPLVYRHLRLFGATHIFGGGVAAAAALICLAYSAYPWAAMFLVIGALNVAGGYWYLTIDRSARARKSVEDQA